MSNNTCNASTGIGLGFFISGFISYVLNGFWWSVLHAFFGWLYIIYAVIFRHNEFAPAFRAFFQV